MASDGEQVRMVPNYAVRRVFKDDEENILAKYLLKLSKMCYGLSSEECCTLAYEMATRNNIVIPNSWVEQKKAGIEWYRSFIARHKDLSLRRPEACSLSRATSFNKHNVNIFFDNLQNFLNRYPEFLETGSNIWNLDETGTTTAQKPPKVIASKGLKQVNQCTSADSGVLVTTCCFIIKVKVRLYVNLNKKKNITYTYLFVFILFIPSIPLPMYYISIII